MSFLDLNDERIEAYTVTYVATGFKRNHYKSNKWHPILPLCKGRRAATNTAKVSTAIDGGLGSRHTLLSTITGS